MDEEKQARSIPPRIKDRSAVIEKGSQPSFFNAQRSDYRGELHITSSTGCLRRDKTYNGPGTAIVETAGTTQTKDGEGTFDSKRTSTLMKNSFRKRNRQDPAPAWEELQKGE